ncbi:MAG: ATP-binding protein [Chthoniobacteraceae bacterium]
MNEPKPAATFAELLTAELASLTPTARRMPFRTGEVIFRQGDPGDGIYVVEEGVVDITALVGGQQQRILTQIEAGGFFGEMAVVDREPRSATATAGCESVLRFVPAEELWCAFERSPRLPISLMREFSQRMRHTDRRFVEEVIQAERLGLLGRFAQSIVHDFKNPLNMIGFAADAAAAEDASPEMRAEVKAIIRKQVDRMANMIGELLEFTRGTAATVRLKPLNYHALIHDVMREIETESTGRNVELTCVNQPPDVTIAADATRLMRVFFNLIHNAIEMMPQGGRVLLRSSADEKHVTTEIEDTGPGIAPEIAARLFQPFATHGKAHGTGLGLSICKRIIEDHGGQITARSEPGHGAIFVFTLPR